VRFAPDPEPVLAWGRVHLRDLPWRASRDPWAVLVSEVMAQQTQVDRVVPKWHDFLDRWPDATSCAAAELADILLVWSGLGYPRRARNLQAAATAIVERHGGEVPDDRQALEALPGVGPYTATAVLAFAFERDVGVVDTNIARVLARSVGRGLTAREAREIAETSVPDGEGWWWNQTLMEVGARCCRPRVPQCDACPLARRCSWLLAGHPEPDPAVGSALVSGRQARFEGSQRQVRGRVLGALAGGPASLDSLIEELVGTRALVEADAVVAAVASLVADGLVSAEGECFRLG
jgi:A/G-specific adenine glycosylase